MNARLHQYCLSQPTSGHWTTECSSRRHKSNMRQCFQSVGVSSALSISLYLTLIRSCTRHPYGLASTHCGLYFLPGPLFKKTKSNINKQTQTNRWHYRRLHNHLLCFFLRGGGTLWVAEGEFVWAHAVRMSWCERCIKCAVVMLPYKMYFGTEGDASV